MVHLKPTYYRPTAGKTWKMAAYRDTPTAVIRCSKCHSCIFVGKNQGYEIDHNGHVSPMVGCDKTKCDWIETIVLDEWG